MREKLFHRDFTLVVIGQIISLLGNAVLRFVLPLYLLDVTGSRSLFGLCSAAAFVPMVVLTPLGGVVADRLHKQRIMVVLDFFTCALVALTALALGHLPLVPVLVAAMLVISTFDYHHFHKLSVVVFGIAVFLLVFLLEMLGVHYLPAAA